MKSIRRFFAWVRQHPLPGILVFMCIAIVLLEVVNLFVTTFIVNKGQFSWQNLQPGKSTAQDVLKNAGEPIDKTTVGDTTILSYTSNFPVYPNKVYLTKDKVSFVEEWIDPATNQTLKTYTDKLGQADLITRAAGTESFELHVFLRAGLAVNAHALEDNVLFVWHFKPMTQEAFFTQFAGYLDIQQNAGPENIGNNASDTAR